MKMEYSFVIRLLLIRLLRVAPGMDESLHTMDTNGVWPKPVLWLMLLLARQDRCAISTLLLLVALALCSRGIAPAIDDKETCDYAGDGGSVITHYVIEYDEEADFSSPATSVTVPSSATEFRIGGRDVLSGSESSILKAGGTYYARIVPFNALGPGVIETFHSAIGPLVDDAPTAPFITGAFPVSATSVRVNWDTPSFDGGGVIEEYLVEYDMDSNFGNPPRNTSIAAVSEVHTVQVGSDESDLNVHVIRATVAVTNEVQSIKTEIEGVDEVQKISTTCDDVTAEVQMIVTTAVDTNEEQVVSLVADDIDEIQLLRLESDNQVEIQSVQVSVQRLNEIQKLGIVISNINTAGDGILSTSCMGLNVGDPCQDVEDDPIVVHQVVKNLLQRSHISFCA